MLLRGDWKLTDSGVMDRTHLRWFTPRAYADLFESSGYGVESVGPATPLRVHQKVIGLLLGGRYHLLMRRVSIRARRR